MGTQNNNFREHSRRKQKKAKLGILGAKVSGSLGLNPLQSNPLKPFSRLQQSRRHARGFLAPRTWGLRQHACALPLSGYRVGVTISYTTTTTWKPFLRLQLCWNQDQKLLYTTPSGWWWWCINSLFRQDIRVPQSLAHAWAPSLQWF